MTVRLSQITVVALLLAFSALVLPFIQAYLNNIENLQLGLADLAPDMLLAAGVLVAVSFAVMFACRGRVRVAVTLLFWYLAILFWWKANFLIGDYGFFDGAEPDWDANARVGWYELLLAVCLAAVFIRYRAIVIDNIRFVGFVLILTTAAYVPGWLAAVNNTPDKRYSFTREGVYDLSSTSNVFLLVLDTMQADVFNEVLQRDDSWYERLSGFTFFRNSLSAFPKTYASVAALLSGVPYDNSQRLPEYLSRAYRELSVPAQLNRAGYDVRLHSFAPYAMWAHPAVADNVQDASYSKVSLGEARDKDRQILANMVLFRLSPHYWRPRVYNDGDFLVQFGGGTEGDPGTAADCRLAAADRVASRELGSFDAVFIDKFQKCSQATLAEPAFRLYHLNAAHLPLRYDENFEFIGNQPVTRSNFVRQSTGAMTVAERMLNRLKELGLYDSSLVIIVGDHGGGEFNAGLNLDFDDLPARAGDADAKPDWLIWGALPLVLVKPPGAVGALQVSDAPVELTDVPATITGQLKLAAADGAGVDMFEVGEDAQRTRRHKHYGYSGWDMDYLLPLTEFVISGFSWYPESWAASPRDLNRAAEQEYSGELIAMMSSSVEEMGLADDWKPAGTVGRRIRADHASVAPRLETGEDVLLTLQHSQYSHLAPATETVQVWLGEAHLADWAFEPGDGQWKKSLVIPASLASRLPEDTLVFRTNRAGDSRVVFREIHLEPASKYNYRAGSRIDFGNMGNSLRYRTHGWLLSEPRGAPSIGHESGIFLNVSGDTPRVDRLEVEIKPYLFPHQAEQRLDITLNGKLIQEVTLSDNKPASFSIPIPPDLARLPGAMDLRFHYKTPTRASGKKVDPGTKLRAISLRSMRLVPAETAG